MCLEAKGPNPQQDRGGDCSVCVGDDGLTNLLSLLSAKIRHRAGLDILGNLDERGLELLAGDAGSMRVTKGRRRDCVARGRASQPGSRLAHGITC